MRYTQKIAECPNCIPIRRCLRLYLSLCRAYFHKTTILWQNSYTCFGAVAMFTSSAGGVRSIVMSMPVYLFVFLSAHITRKPQGRTSSMFLCVLPMVVARSPSDSVAIRLPVLWMTSCFHVTTLRCVFLSGDRTRQS